MINPIGAHFSIHKGYLVALEEALSVGADALQIFSKSPMSAKLRKVTKEESESIKNWKDRSKIKNIIIHASYLLNFAKDLEISSYPIKSLAEDLENANLLGADGVVLHMGKYLDLPRDEAKKNFVKNIKKVLSETKNTQAKILIENTAGQGTEFGYDLNEISEIKKEFGDEKRVGFCIDLAHAFGAGYDLKTKEGVADFIEMLENSVGIKNIGCIHFNDSKKPLGSKVDRHQDIGEGEIGIEGLAILARELNKKGGEKIPLILETPQEKIPYNKQIEMIKSWFR